MTQSVAVEIQNGKIPSVWETVQLGDVCTLVNGKAFKPSDWSDSGIPIIRIQNLNDLSKPFNHWAGSLERQVIVEDGAVLLGWSGTPGTSFGAHLWNRGKAILNQHIFRVDVDARRVVKEWAVPAINHKLEILIGKAHGGVGLRHVKKSEVERLLIRLPPLSEQRHIAAALTEQLAAVKRARVAAEARLAAAKEVSKSILRSVFESHDALKWPRQMLADFAETCSGTTPDRNRPDYFGGKIPWVKTGELLDGIIECTGESVTELALGACSLSLLPPGTLLIAMYGQGQTRGRTAILAVPATTNQACFAILPNKDFDTRFLQFWFQYSYDRLRHETESRGGNQPNLNGVFLSRQNIPFPSLVDQRQIVARLSKQLNAAKTVYARIRDELATIDLMPEALLQLAFCEM